MGGASAVMGRGDFAGTNGSGGRRRGPAPTGGLRAVGRVVKPGKRLIVTSAEIAHVAGDGRASACALMQQTLMAVPKAY